MSAGPRRSGRVADMNAASTARAARGHGAATGHGAARGRAASAADRDGYKLSTDLTKRSKNLIEMNAQEYIDYPINSEDWIVFFCDYFDYIQNNIDPCLSKIKGLSHLTIGDLYKVDLSGGGFDSEFDNFDKLDYNIGLYDALFTQFKDGTNKINNCVRLNLLLSYIGAAVQRMAGHYNKTSANALIEFYRKIATILEIAVYPEVFLHYMTGDSTGHTHTIDLNYHGQAKIAFYTGIWVRKQEFLGVVTSEGKNYWRKLDNGMRLFVRNYIRRLITYMRSYNATYPLDYELPYNYSADPAKVARYPLPVEGAYKYSAPPENYYISRDDWNFIPNIFLPDNCAWNSRDKDYIDPTKWNHPPPLWWIERTVELFEETEWWRVKDSVVEAISTRLRGTVRHKKWMAINCILPQQYESYNELWDAEYEDELNEEYEEGYADYEGYGGISKMNNKSKARLASTPRPIFKIIQDKDRMIHPDIYKELKYKLRDYFKLNVVVVKAKSAQSYLQDDTYIDNLCNYSMLYNPRAHKMNKNKSASDVTSSSKRKMRAKTV